VLKLLVEGGGYLMGVQGFLEANGIVNKTPLGKVFGDILGTTSYDEVVMAFLDNNGAGLKDLKIDVTLKEVDRLFFILPLLNTLFNYKIDFNSKVFQGLKWRLEYVSSKGFINKDYLEKYLIEWGIYEDYHNLRSQRPGIATDSFLRLID
jgi:hypothetical protein